MHAIARPQPDQAACAGQTSRTRLTSENEGARSCLANVHTTLLLRDVARSSEPVSVHSQGPGTAAAHAHLKTSFAVAGRRPPVPTNPHGLLFAAETCAAVDRVYSKTPRQRWPSAPMLWQWTSVKCNSRGGTSGMAFPIGHHDSRRDLSFATGIPCSPR